MKALQRIGLFGGTFDPVHLGHMQVAKRSMEQFQLNQVRWIPCHVSPHKMSQEITSVEERLEMLRLATLGEDWAEVDDIEAIREGVSYSWQTAQEMRERFPAARLYWIMGTDQWDALERWQFPERLAMCVEFIVFTRGAVPRRREGYELHVIEADHPASSTQIRKDLAGGGLNREGHPWLDGKVFDWLKQKKIYQH